MADTVVRTAEAKERLRAAASAPLEETYALLQTSPAGLGEGEVRARRARFGENALPAQKKRGAALRLLLAFANPFTAILLALALVSACTDIFFAAAGERNYVTVGVILVMVGVSGVLRFVQETKSSAAAEKTGGHGRLDGLRRARRTGGGGARILARPGRRGPALRGGI